ncbi:hypothetical protein [Cohnella cholangitidis]|uniref:YmcC n=1 Tax=Cohnella cholangitidis TaxID=2598458 RepID=A0A7G5BZR2_9BACL|nr:hypothetical protein [Cohnella cholangitidis]QMV42446.1 hypothetical protein FPL14_15500 [Cohnella cholangitidis]
MITVFIIGCEIAFWVFVLAGLASRYILRRKKLGAVLLYCTPVIDLVLLIATVIDLRGGAEANAAHGLAAVYIGASIAYGHSMIRWADVRFAHRYAGGPAPQKKAKFGVEHARNERKGWYLHALAWIIGCGILYGMIAMVNADDRTEGLLQVIRIWSLVLAIDFLISFSYTLWPKSQKNTSSEKF